MLKRKNPKSFSDQVKDTIRIVTFNPDVLPVGSFMFKDIRYPGDIDILEFYNGCCDERSVANAASNRLRQMIYEITQQKDIYFSEFKSGLDMNMLENSKIARAQGNIALAELYKAKSVLRWTEQEVLSGMKELSTGAYIDLADSLAYDTIVKLDIWSLTGDRYIESSNFMILTYTDKDGKEHPINAKLFNLVDRVREDVEKYLKINPFKALKRIWILANVFKKPDDIKLRDKITDLVSSDVGLLYQLITDIETVRLMAEGVPNYPYVKLMQILSNMKDKFAFITNVPLDFEYIYNSIDMISNSGIRGQSLLNNLLSLELELRGSLERITRQWIKANKILPLDERYLPPKPTLESTRRKGGAISGTLGKKNGKCTSDDQYDEKAIALEWLFQQIFMSNANYYPRSLDKWVKANPVNWDKWENNLKENTTWCDPRKPLDMYICNTDLNKLWKRMFGSFRKSYKNGKKGYSNFPCELAQWLRENRGSLHFERLWNKEVR